MRTRPYSLAHEANRAGRIEALREIAAMAEHEADMGAPSGMVAVYVDLALRHLTLDHPGHWSACNPCHYALSAPFPGAARKVLHEA